MPVEKLQTSRRKGGTRSPLARHLRRVMPAVDLRTSTAKRWRVVYVAYRARLEGPDGLSERDEQWARDLTVLEMAKRDMQAAQIKGKAVDAGTYSKIVARLERAERQIEARRRESKQARPSGDVRSRSMGVAE